jgi:lipid-binding SYLF domain-containing protein
VSVEGSAIQIDEEANAAFYDSDTISARDILFDEKKLDIPAIAQKLIRILTEYTSTRL